MRQAFSVVPPILVLLLLVLPSVDAACSASTSGTLLVPTGTGNPPLFATPLMNSVVVQFVHTYAPGEYNLFATGTTSTACVLSTCSSVPDFNVAWYKTASPFDQLVRNDNQMGDQTATIPPLADYALIYMRYGPDASTTDGSAAAGYTFLTGC